MANNEKEIQTTHSAGSGDHTMDAVIVGAGPAGMATALMLAKRGFSKTALLERNPTIGEQEIATRSKCIRKFIFL